MGVNSARKTKVNGSYFHILIWKDVDEENVVAIIVWSCWSGDHCRIITMWV